jgi:hypothetical protein
LLRKNPVFLQYCPKLVFMPGVTESKELAENIIRLRRAERVPAVAGEVSPVRRGLESQLGPTLTRSRTAAILGVSQTALDRWVGAGKVPVVLTPSGRRAVPRQFVIEIREAIDELRKSGRHGHLLAAALADRRDGSAPVSASLSEERRPLPRSGHQIAERRGLAYHAIVAERLNEQMVEEARERVDQLTLEGHLHRRYAEQWQALLSLPLAEISRAIAADDEEGRDLRQNSPFAGVLNEQERRRIIEAIR